MSDWSSNSLPFNKYYQNDVLKFIFLSSDVLMFYAKEYQKEEDSNE